MTMSGETDDVIFTLNVGGKVFQTHKSTLRKQNVGVLSRLTVNDEHYSTETKQFFFDQDAELFCEVLRFYRTGVLHFPPNYCLGAARRDLEFWGLPEDIIGDCCWRAYNRARDQLKIDTKLTKQSRERQQQRNLELKKGCKSQLWTFLEYPTSSTAATVWVVCLIILFVASIMCCALTTLTRGKVYLHSLKPINISEIDIEQYSDSRQFIRRVIFVDSFCLAVFTFELLLRIIACPSKLGLVKSCHFVCDLIYLIPGILVNALVILESDFPVSVGSTLISWLLKISTITRIFRIIRLAWYFSGIRLLCRVLCASLRELIHLGIFLGTGSLIYGFLIYSVEVSANKELNNAFHGFWWAVVTMSTVGYGDFYPKTIPGYIIATFCAVSGLVLVGMPIPIIANNFQLYNGFRERRGCEPPKKSPRSPIDKIKEFYRSEQYTLPNVTLDCSTKDESILNVQTYGNTTI